jgi:hypothetical protein
VNKSQLSYLALGRVGDIPVERSGKAEGIAVLHESNNDCTILIVCDGITNGGTKKFTILKDWK